MADRTSSTLVIAAARQAVMAIIADFGRYPDWAKGVRAADIVETGADGRAERVRFTLDAGPIKDSYVLAYDWDDDSAVRWQLAEPGSMVTEMSGGYRLAEDGSGTKTSYELAVSTRLPLPGILKRRAEKMIIDAALKGLKSRAEADSGRGAG
jgi:Polyketide cyclase / dehydrase and lipid transport